MKIFSLLLLCLLITACSSKAPETTEEHIKFAEKSGKVVLIQIGNDTCGPCVDMKNILKRVEEDYQNRIKIIRIDTIKEPELTRKYAIQKVPTQIFIDAKGNEFGRNEGYYSYEEIAFVLKDMGVKLF
ncbi:MAG: thioredoxin family protein [Nitrospirae bacterium]|nr:thioredoxin family protein [Nitrospirota bacterium]